VLHRLATGAHAHKGEAPPRDAFSENNKLKEGNGKCKNAKKLGLNCLPKVRVACW